MTIYFYISPKRIFNVEWKGFPYEGYDENGNKEIKYWTPEEYYEKKNVDDKLFIFPWERICERINHEKIKADINISYENKDGEIVEYSSAKEFYVSYKEKYVGLNPYAFICSSMIFLILFLLWIIFRKKKIICINKDCERKIEKDMKICPYCETHQKGFKKEKLKKIRKFKKFQKENLKINKKKNGKINKKKKKK